MRFRYGVNLVGNDRQQTRTVRDHRLASQRWHGRGLSRTRHEVEARRVIKILPEESRRDRDRVARFQREAEVLASLSHPNIAAIHSLEEEEGSRFLVLELVEGETLEDRGKRGPIPIEEALHIAESKAQA